MRRTPAEGPASFVKWSDEELKLNDEFHKCTKCVHETLCGMLQFVIKDVLHR